MGYFCFDLGRIFNENLSFSSLKPIFKALHSDFLFGEFNPNDANILNEKFYRELLYILGLSEVDEKGREIKDSSKVANKILIEPSLHSKNGANTLYNEILANLPKESTDFESAMQFIVLWLNRILFLKLIEANLVRFNNDKNLKFLNLFKVPDFQVMSHLFFKILAKKHDERDIGDSPLSYLPYLNSSLFERHKCEDALDISAIDNNAKLNYFATTQIKDKYGKAKSGSVGLLAYIFEFLDAFDFGADEGSGEIAMQKELISSSVLGLVFEKLNGYKEGSFFTPSFITSYMCRISLEKVVLQKFGELGLNAVDLDSLKSQILMNTNADFSFRQKALGVLKSIRICDPAVGSGHFLVSALCEMIGIYHKLGLIDELSEYKLQISNDEIIIHITRDKVFEYKKPTKPNDKNQSIQKALFHLKKSIIENNLFGVDINPNSVEICKLRLWIELLKNSYYLRDSDKGFSANLSESIHQMQTLPNIDINIKCGNSLVSNFTLDSTFAKAQTKEFAQNLKATIAAYKAQVALYKEALTQKRVIADEIQSLKTLLKNYLIDNKPESKRLRENLRQFVVEYGENHFDIESTFGLEMLRIIRKEQKKNVGFKFQPTMEQLEPKAIDKKAVDLVDKIKADFEILESFKSGNALEWRFEFPEVLDKNGDFMGFDLIIGNPPYGVDLSPQDRQTYKNIYNLSSTNTAQLFILLADKITSPNGLNTFIVPKSLVYVAKWKPLRDILKPNLYILADCGKAWSYVLLEMVIYAVHKNHKCDSYANTFLVDTTKRKSNESGDEEIMPNPTIMIDKNLINLFGLFINNLSQSEIDLGVKMRNIGDMLGKYCENSRGVTYQNKLTQKGKYGFIGGKEINKYGIKQYKGFTKIIKNIPNNALIKENALLAQNIVTQNRVIAMLPQTQNAYLLDTINQLVFKKLDSRLVWAILNSTAMNWYIAKFIFSNAKMTMHFDAPATDKIPIPKLNATNKKIADKITNLVDKILESKAKDSQSNTTALESQIDDLVYQLYDLDSTEIQIIES